jgi:4-hydroxy-tetrahydrodipicolinate synthase
MTEISGVLTAMATPFSEDGSLDIEAGRRLARHLVEHGSHGVVVAGSTGESSTLSDEEKLELLSAVLEEIGDEATVIAGTGSNDTRHTVELTEAAAEAGAHAALVVTPYYNKPNPAGLMAHYREVNRVGIPLVLYNIPSRVVINIDPDGLAELGQLSNVVAVKQANDDELGPIDGLAVLAGNDNVFRRVLEFGGAGGILVASHLVGDQMRQMWDAAQDGDTDRVAEIDASLAEVYAALSLNNPIPLKAALEMLGLTPGTMRLPMVPADDEQRASVRAALEHAGLLARAA